MGHIRTIKPHTGNIGANSVRQAKAMPQGGAIQARQPGGVISASEDGMEFSEAAGKLASQASGAARAKTHHGSKRDILREIGLRVEDSEADGSRRVTLRCPKRPFRTMYEMLIEIARSRLGATVAIAEENLKSGLVDGPKDDKIPVGKRTFTLHAKSGNMMRETQAGFLGRQGQEFANPWIILLAEMASLAQTGRSLFKFGDVQHNGYLVRTAEAETRNGTHIFGLASTHGYGVQDTNDLDDPALCLPEYIAAGSPITEP